MNLINNSEKRLIEIRQMLSIEKDEWLKAYLKERRNQEQKWLKKLVKEREYENQGLNPPFTYGI